MYVWFWWDMRVHPEAVINRKIHADRKAIPISKYAWSAWVSKFAINQQPRLSLSLRRRDWKEPIEWRKLSAEQVNKFNLKHKIGINWVELWRKWLSKLAFFTIRLQFKRSYLLSFHQTDILRSLVPSELEHRPQRHQTIKYLSDRF